MNIYKDSYEKLYKNIIELKNQCLLLAEIDAKKRREIQNRGGYISNAATFQARANTYIQVAEKLDKIIQG